MVEKLLDQIEENEGIENTIGIETLIEETEALQNVDEIAATGDRLEALIFGPGDYSASQGVQLKSIGAHGDEGTIPAMSGTTCGIRSSSRPGRTGSTRSTAPYGDFSDPEGYREECVRSFTLGFVGKWAIHPSQIEIANGVYKPEEDQVEHAQKRSSTRWKKARAKARVPSASTGR